MASLVAEQVAANLPRKSRKPLKSKKNPENDSNIMAGNPIVASPLGVSSVSMAEKENPISVGRKNKSSTKKGVAKPAVEDLQKVLEKLERLTLEKERAEELLKQKDALLKQKEEELENRGKDHDRLRAEMKKLQKLKEFKPIMELPDTNNIEGEGKGDKSKKKKEKKPCSAYILWCKEQWNQVKNENPEAEFKEIGNILGSKWKGLSAEEKKLYEDRCQADRKVYQQIVGREKRQNEAMKLLMEQKKQKTAMELLEQYLQFKQDSVKETKKKGKEKDPSKPKKPLSAFFLYSNERRTSLAAESKNVLEIAKLAGEEWKNMSDDRKAPYQEIAMKEKERYLKEMELYKLKKAQEAEEWRHEEEETTKLQKHEALQLLKKKEKIEKIIKDVKDKKKKQKKQKDANKPKRPATSFLLFSKEVRKILVEENPNINNTSLSALISIRWKELNEEEKKIWNEKAAAEMAAYKMAMEEYNKKSSEAKKSNSEREGSVPLKRLNNNFGSTQEGNTINDVAIFSYVVTVT